MVKKKFLTIPELAKLLGKSRIAVYKDVKSGKIAATRIGRNYAISDRNVAHILGKKMSEKDKRKVSVTVKKVVREYSEVLKKLSKE
jgi:excisionase family DNA binding protein